VRIVYVVPYWKSAKRQFAEDEKEPRGAFPSNYSPSFTRFGWRG
jgi:hypothetical protein